MALTADDGDHPTSSLDSARRDVLELRKALGEDLEVETAATSIDGRAFEFQSSLDDPIPLGGFVELETRDGRRYLGQVTDRRIDRRPGARVMVDIPEVEFGAARVSQAEIQLEIGMAVGSGTLLARLAEDGLATLAMGDVFDRAAMAQAEPEVVARFLASMREGVAALDIGWSPFGGPEVRTTLLSAGFNRHTFLCGQSGSGKTFSLGVVLERLLLDTALRMIVIDPNSDFVGLDDLRPKESFDRTVAVPPAGRDYDVVAGRYRSAVDTVRVLRPTGDGDALRVRFSDLTPHEQAATLRLDALEDNVAFSAFRRMLDQLEGRPYSLQDVRRASMDTFQDDARQIGVRIENLGVAAWDVWADGDAPALSDHLDADWRGLVLDTGGLGSQLEQSVVAMSLLGSLWRRRAERQPILVVIDEAHNVCPAEPTSELQKLATEHVVRIAGEGRKFGIYLLVSTQRPQKLHPNVLSQCDNLVLMRMNSFKDVEHLGSTFSFVPPRLLEQATQFTLGEALVAGKISPTPTIAKIEGRLSPEGGGDVAATWAARVGG